MFPHFVMLQPQEEFCKSLLKTDHHSDVRKIVNVIMARALKYRQFDALLEECDTEHGAKGYCTAIRWLSLGKVLKNLGPEG